MYMTKDKNLVPHNFKFWHDTRINEYNSKKAELDKIEREKQYKKFEMIANKYSDFPDDTLITSRQENQESIHRHNAYAEKVTTMGELKEELNIE